MLGGEAVSGQATVLTHSDIHARNTFDAPDAVKPRTEAWSPSGRTPKFTFARGFRNPATTQTRMSGTDTLVRALWKFNGAK